MRHWLSAFRLRTLPLALSSIAMGAFLARAAGAFAWDVFFWSIITTIFLQILSNLANDYGDFVHGADHDDRKGPQRAVQSGMISPASMRTAIGLFVVLSLMSGLVLLYTAFGFDWRAIGFFLMLGLLSIVAAVTYTAGRKPYGYIGLGDVSVLVFFGIVGVLGSYYLFTHSISVAELFPALSTGLLAVAVLNVNNIRDIDSDRKAGKYSIPVRIGRERAVRYHQLLLVAAVVFAIAYTLVRFEGIWQFLFLLATPLLVRNAKAVRRLPAAQLDPWLKHMALSALAFVILFGTGLLLS
jgi:1,4-dihydroxy-2-naphthoate octaprenyltransferase